MLKHPMYTGVAFASSLAARTFVVLESGDLLPELDEEVFAIAHCVRWGGLRSVG